MASRIQELSIDTTQTQGKFISTPKPASPPQKKQKMSLSQTYVLAHTARGKLSKEAARPDHDLRLLVGHANLLDSLMLELADAEREQERWFNQTVKRASKTASTEPRHVQWADTIAETEWEAEDSDSDIDEDEDEVDMAAAIPPRTSRMTAAAEEEEEEDEYEDEDEDIEDLALTRTHSHSPPELLQDSDDDSSEDEQPPSPPSQALEYSEKERQNIATTSFYETAQASSDSLSRTEQQPFFDEGFYLAERNAPAMVAVC